MSTEPTTPQEWIEHNRALREAEGLSRADQDMIKALAQQVVIDKLGRAEMGPANSKGRCDFIFHGEPTKAEQHWNEMMAATRQARVVQGGPLKGKEF